MPFLFFNYKKGDAMDKQKEITVFLAEFDYQIEQILKVRPLPIFRLFSMMN